MIYVPTQALQQINSFLLTENPVLLLCPNGVVASAWANKIKQLSGFNKELCKIKMSPKYKYPTIISREIVLIYPDFQKVVDK